MHTMNREGKSYAAALVAARTGREVPDLLRELYVERRHTQAEIALALGVSRRQVSTWLSQYGITRDDRPPVVLEGVA